MTALVQTTSDRLQEIMRLDLHHQPPRTRPTTVGRIRGGAKVLTAAAKKFQAAVDIYNTAIADAAENGIPDWNVVEAEIRNACPDMRRSPLTPVNSPRFFLRRKDFGSDPAVFDRILERYGEDQNGRRILTRFPVMFAVDDPYTVVQTGFEEWKASAQVRWSETNPETNVSMCRERVQLDRQEGPRRRRYWGGRPIIDHGPCDPNQCPHFDAGNCNYVGRIFFYVPDIGAAGMFELQTKSWYSVDHWRRTLKQVLSYRGYLSGVQNGEPLFWLRKVERDVAHIDPDTNKSMRRRQFIIELDVHVDMGAFFIEQEQLQRLAHQPHAHLPEPPDVTDVVEGELVDIPESEVPF